jgi:hypothetical protein
MTAAMATLRKLDNANPPDSSQKHYRPRHRLAS